MSVLDPPHVTGRRTERLVRILELLGDHRQVPVSTLCRQLGVSEATMRRDLTVLESQSLLTRSYGTAATVEQAEEFPVRYRSVYNLAAKKRIAAACQNAISRKPQAIAVSGGTTTLEVARLLADRRELTIVTNALNIASELAHRPHARIVLTGGTLRPESLELVGPWTERLLDSTQITTVVMGVDGISAHGGLTTHDPVEARANQHMIRRGHRLVVVADASKVGVITPARMVDIDRATLLITDKSAPATDLAAIEAAGVEVWRV